MISQIGAAPSVAGASQPASAAPAASGARPDAPPRAQAAVRPETARAVDPPQPAGKTPAVPAVERRDLNPPDPDAPAGPPPAFEASILDRARDEAKRPPDLREAEVVAAAPADRSGPAASAAKPATAPATASDTAEAPRAEAVEGPRIARAPGGEVAPADDTVPEVTPTAPTARESDPGSRPAGDGGTEAEAPRQPEESRGPYEVPPSAEERAERQVATIRRIETPYDTATVDVSR